MIVFLYCDSKNLNTIQTNEFLKKYRNIIILSKSKKSIKKETILTALKEDKKLLKKFNFFYKYNTLYHNFKYSK